MALELFVTGIAVFFGLNIVLTGATIWLFGKRRERKRLSPGRALATALTLVVPAAMAGVYTLDRETLAGLLGAVGLIGAFFVVKHELGATAGRTILCLVTCSVVSLAVFLPMVLLIQNTLFGLYKVPSCSMAPAVIGNHFEITCPGCGRRQSLGVLVGLPAENAKRSVEEANCPNCSTRLAKGTLSRLLPGDRILVARLATPQRWDVIAHVNPSFPDRISLNRLIGLPGETIEIADGDVFADGRRLTKPLGRTTDPEWILVHDSVRRIEKPIPTRVWEPDSPDSPWQPNGSGWIFSGDQSSREELRFTKEITDEFLYNMALHWPRFREHVCSAGDVRIDALVTGLSGEGGFGMSWSYRGDEVRARLSAAGSLSLESNGHTEEGALPDQSWRTLLLSLGVRDGKAFVLVDGEPSLTADLYPEKLEDCMKKIAAGGEPCRLSLFAEACRLVLERLIVWRDIEYVNPPGRSTGYGCTGHPITLGQGEYYVLADNPSIAMDSRMFQWPRHSSAEEYHPGTVPEDFILGPMRAIWWPPSRWWFATE